MVITLITAFNRNSITPNDVIFGLVPYGNLINFEGRMMEFLCLLNLHLIATVVIVRLHSKP